MLFSQIVPPPKYTVILEMQSYMTLGAARYKVLIRPYSTVVTRVTPCSNYLNSDEPWNYYQTRINNVSKQSGLQTE